MGKPVGMRKPFGGILALGLLAALAWGPTWHVDGLNAGPSSRTEVYTGLWREGSGAQYWHAQLSADELQAQDRQYLNQGLRLHDLEPIGRRGAVVYLGVWREGSGEQRWHIRMSFDELINRDQQYLNRGLRLHDIEFYEGLYSAVWRPGSGTQFWHAGLSWREFQSKDNRYFDQGLRLIDVEAYPGRSGDTRYAAVWRQGSGTQWIHTGMSLSELRNQDERYFQQQDLRLVDVERRERFRNQAPRYTAVWREGSGAQWWHTGLDQSEFQNRDRRYFDQGLRLQDAELTFKVASPSN